MIAKRARPVGATLRLLAVAIAVALGPGPSVAAATQDDPDVLAVQFELAEADGADQAGPLRASGPVDALQYAALHVDHGGVTRRLEPLAGPVSASPLSPGSTMAAELDGLRIGHLAEGFEATLSEVFASPSLGRFARLGTGADGGPVAIELGLPRPLRAGDYLLVQEASGDGVIDIDGLGPDGATVGSTTVGPPYRWNSGQQTAGGVTQWASVIDVGQWLVGHSITGLRIRASEADVKVLVLEHDGTPGPIVEAATQADTMAPTALAMTGMPTDPWMLVALATGGIFFGYTAVAAFRRPSHLAEPGERAGHANLDALGFD